MTTSPFTFNHENFDDLFDANRSMGYPGNHFAFRHVLNILHERDARRLVEVGVGNGNAISFFSGPRLEFWGFDNNPDLVDKSKLRMQQYDLPQERILWGDIEDSITLTALRNSGGFDGLVAMGVLPHVSFERPALRNMFHLLNPGGTAFVECRNKLFSLFTFNRFTFEFIMEDLLGDVDPEVTKHTEDFLKTRLDTDVPPPPQGHAARQHNPLTIDRTFFEAGFTNVVVRPFHYHAAIPRFEKSIGGPFRAESIRLENETSDWRGLFLCSAFLVEAQRPLD